MRFPFGNPVVSREFSPDPISICSEFAQFASASKKIFWQLAGLR
jgi:hypothetical protein